MFYWNNKITGVTPHHHHFSTYLPPLMSNQFKLWSNGLVMSTGRQIQRFLIWINKVAKSQNIFRDKDHHHKETTQSLKKSLRDCIKILAGLWIFRIWQLQWSFKIFSKISTWEVRLRHLGNMSGVLHQYF